MNKLGFTEDGEKLMEKLFGTPGVKWWSESLGRIEIAMTEKQSEMVPLSGDAEEGVLALSKEPEIKAQMDKIKPKLLAECLSEYGAWDEEQLKDHEQNIQRLLWLAASDIQEQDDTIICTICEKTVPEHGYCDKDGSGYGECCWDEHADKCESCKEDVNNA